MILSPPVAFYNSGSFRGAWDRPEYQVRVNIGCGLDYRPGWINVDLHHRADLAFDVTESWPLEDASVDLVWCNQIVEHLPPLNSRGQDAFLAFLGEAQRVLRPGGRLMVSVPWPGSRVDLANVTHYRRFCPESLHFLDAGSDSTLAGAWRLRVVRCDVIRVPPLAGAAKALPSGPPKRLRWYPNVGRRVGIAWVLERAHG